MTDLALEHGLRFADFYDRDGLVRVDQAFVAGLAETDIALHDRLMTARHDPDAIEHQAESDLVVDLAPHLEDFIGVLFGITAEVRTLQALHHELAPLYSVKRLFVQRRAVKGVKEADAGQLDGPSLARELDRLMVPPPDDTLTIAAWERRYAEHVANWLADESSNDEALATAQLYAAWATLAPEGRRKHNRGVLFKVPHRLDMQHLVPVETVVRDGVTMLRRPEEEWRRREGFALTDPGTDLTGALDQANYCIWCHNQGKDSCAKGLREKDGAFKKTVFGVTLAGCPLEEKISEMNLVKARGNGLGALAIITVDNPICAATGHRICNDCMKACIYQRQDPVDIPQIETRTLKDVLGLPWGFEIYSLLTRWNPLNIRRPVPRPATGRKVLVVGLGPAGFTLAHHLLNDGHFVAAIDGLKIEPLPTELSGVMSDGARVPFRPIRDVASLVEGLDDRVMAGFGGVAEYGITVRWDKNFLKIVRLLLERRADFAMYGGVRFGGTITIDGALRSGLRSRGAVRRGRPADRDPDAERSRPGSSASLGFSDGIAADRGGQDHQHRQSDRAAPGGRDRRRADGDRHGDRVARLLPGAGREVSVALRDPRRRARRGGGERGLERRGARGRSRVHRPWPRDPRRARGRPPRWPPAAPGGAARRLGRGHDRLPPASDRCAELHPQPRGGG